MCLASNVNHLHCEEEWLWCHCSSQVNQAFYLIVGSSWWFLRWQSMPFLQTYDALVWHEQSQGQNRDACTHRDQYLRCGDWNINEMRNKRLKSPLAWEHVLFLNHTETFWLVMTRQIQRNIRGDFPRLLMLYRYTLKPLFANSRLSGIRNIMKTNRHQQLVQYFLFPKDTHFWMDVDQYQRCAMVIF